MPQPDADEGWTWRQPWFQRYLAEAPLKQAGYRRVVSRLRELGINSETLSPKVLDLGCSVGVFLQVAEEVGWQAYGVETDTAAARYGQRVLGLRIFNGLLADADYPPDFFDAVVSFQVFEHLSDPFGELQRIQRLLRPGGYLVIDVPGIDNWSFRLLRQRHRHFATPQHLYFYTSATISKLLERAEFIVRLIEYPSRCLSLKHICAHHIALYSPRLSKALQVLLQKAHLLDRAVWINLRDIICVYARKTA